MNKINLAAPISTLTATIASIGRLVVLKEDFQMGSIHVKGDSIISFFFSETKTIDVDHSIQIIFATLIVWIVVFSFLWFSLSIFTVIKNRNKNTN